MCQSGNEKLNDMYSSSNIIRMIKSRNIKWAGHGERMGEKRGVCRVLVGKLNGKRPPGRPRRRWLNNMKMDLQEVVYRCMDWIEVVQDKDR